MKKWFSAITALGLLAVGGTAQACVLTAWQGNGGAPGGDAAVYGPDVTVSTPRISGKCSMQVSNGFVQDNSPIGEATYRVRFYVLAESGTGAADVFTAYSDEAGAAPIFTVIYDGVNFTVDGSVGGMGGASTGAIAGAAGWNSVEINWVAGGNMEVWINTDASVPDAADATVAAGNGTIGSARLGAQAPTGSLVVIADEFESRRTTAIGKVLLGDSSGDGCRSFGDAIGILNEFLAPTLPVSGAPDTDGNGSISFGDAIGALNLFLLNDNVCP